MDVEEAAGELVDGLAELHALDQLVDQGRRLWTDDVGAEQQAGVGVDEHLREAGPILHGPAVRGAAVVAATDQVGDALAAQLLFGGADGGDLGVAEHGVGCGPQIDGPEVVGVRDVVGHRAGLGIGRVLELIGVGDVAERPDPLDVGPHVLVGEDVPVVGRDAGEMQVELLAGRLAPGGDEDLVAVQLELLATHACLDAQLAGLDAVHGVDRATQADVAALREHLGEAQADLLVLEAQ